MTFSSAQQSHQHSLYVLNQLYEYDDFMASINTLADLVVAWLDKSLQYMGHQ